MREKLSKADQQFKHFQEELRQKQRKFDDDIKEAQDKQQSELERHQKAMR